MIAIFLSILTVAFAADVTVIRAPQADLQAYNQYLAKDKKMSFAEFTRAHLTSSSPDTSAMDRCLEALAFSPKTKSSICFSSLQDLKKQLWTAPLKRVLIPFLERLIGENLEHKKLYQEIHKSLKDRGFQRSNGELDLALREQRVFNQWLLKQAEWQDARIFTNGALLEESTPISRKAIVQWFVISNAGRTLSFIGTRSGFQNYLATAEDIRFLDCQSISSSAFELNDEQTYEYFLSGTCLTNLKKPKAFEMESVYSRWQQSQQHIGFQNTAKLEKPSVLPKWAVPVLLGVVIGSVTLRGKKVSVRMPEF